jgi:hypothetical protein
VGLRRSAISSFAGSIDHRRKPMERCLQSYYRDIALLDDSNVQRLRVYKCIEVTDFDDPNDKNIPQQADDPQMAVITSTDLTIDAQIDNLFSWNSSDYKILNINVKKLLADGWIPMYDRGYIHWYGDEVCSPQFTTDVITSAQEP